MRTLTPWRPFRELSLLHHDIDDIFSRVFAGEGWPTPTGIRHLNVPRIESFVRDDELVVRADLPGIDPKAVELVVEGDQLLIRAERKAKEEREERDYRYREVSYGRFERAIDLPHGVDTESITAAYHDGVLEVTMKAPKELVSKKIPIAVH